MAQFCDFSQSVHAINTIPYQHGILTVHSNGLATLKHNDEDDDDVSEHEYEDLLDYQSDIYQALCTPMPTYV